MQRRLFVLLALSIALSFARLQAEEAASTPSDPSRVVGSVYGKPVTAAEIKLTRPIDTTVKFDARDKEMWPLMQRIATALGTPVIERFQKNEKITATADELAAFGEHMKKSQIKSAEADEKRLVDIRAKLSATNLPDQERADLLKKQAMFERAQQRHETADNSPPAAGTPFIIAWKTERALQRKYQGRIIFQQFGPEALDARRKLYEEAEKNGDLKFDDAGVRHLFYYYYTQTRHTPADAEALEKPWFLADADKN